MMMYVSADTCSPEPIDPLNGNFTILHGDLTSYGTVVQYQCDPGYQLLHGSPILYCGLDDNKVATWSDLAAIECARK